MVASGAGTVRAKKQPDKMSFCSTQVHEIAVASKIGGGGSIALLKAQGAPVRTVRSQGSPTLTPVWRGAASALTQVRSPRTGSAICPGVGTPTRPGTRRPLKNRHIIRFKACPIGSHFLASVVALNCVRPPGRGRAVGEAKFLYLFSHMK